MNHGVVFNERRLVSLALCMARMDKDCYILRQYPGVRRLATTRLVYVGFKYVPCRIRIENFMQPIRYNRDTVSDRINILYYDDDIQASP